MEREPTQEELDAWLEQERLKDVARYAAKTKEAVKWIEKWADGDKVPKWFDAIERQLGARIGRIDLENGQSFRRVATRGARRIYNWRLAATLIAEGADYWKVAAELGCAVEAVQRRMREGSKLRKWVAEAHALRTQRMEFVAARHGEHLVNGLDGELDELRDDRDPAIKRWLLKRVLGDRPQDSAIAPLLRPENPHLALPDGRVSPARISLNKPKQAGISPDKPKQIGISLNKPEDSGADDTAGQGPPAA